MESFLPLLILPIAYVMDLMFGDPRKLPHPIRWFGNAIYYGERHLNKPSFQLIKGMFLTLILCLSVYGIFHLINEFLKPYKYAYVLFNSIFLFYAIANKSLLEEGKAVFLALKKGLVQGRERLSWIVGRDTKNLNEQEIKKAVFETLSENLSDGIIAPLFYYALLGVPGAMLYKMINTLDSMIGYKNERYQFFGKFAARLDDVFNYLPSRITALLMLIVTFKLHEFKKVFQEGKKHSSPNAGYPEAALAIILNCQFGGPNIYHGKLVDKPYIGTNEREIHQNEFKKVAKINHSTTALFVVIIFLMQIIQKMWL